MMSFVMSENKAHKQYKYFVLIAVIYVALLLLTMFVENRIVALGSIKILCGTLIIPLSYAISDIITEIYGYREMRKLIWISFFALYISAFIIFCVMHLPTDSTNAQSNAYAVVLNSFLKDVVTYSIAALISIFLNSYLISQWKILTSGRIFWLRSLGATMVGEFIFIVTWGFLGFSSQFPLHTLLKLMLVSYICKIIYNLLAITPSSIAVVLLKKAEGIEASDRGINFNPFSLNT